MTRILKKEEKREPREIYTTQMPFGEKVKKS